MPIEFERRSLELTAEEWSVLEALAAEFHTTPPTGSNAGKPAWRSLIKSIADKQIALKGKRHEHTDAKR